MTEHQLTLDYQQQRIQLSIGETDNLLEVLQKLELPVRSACRNGSCGICKCRLESGQIDYFLRQPFGLNTSHILQGFILPCIAFAASDILLSSLSLER